MNPDRPSADRRGPDGPPRRIGILTTDASLVVTNVPTTMALGGYFAARIRAGLLKASIEDERGDRARQ